MNKLIGFHATPEVAEEIDRHVAELGISRAGFLRMITLSWLRDHR